MFAYVTPFADIRRYYRPLLAKKAINDLHIFRTREIIDYFKMWNVVAALDKTRPSRYLTWAYTGFLISLFLSKMGCKYSIILNPIGVAETKLFGNQEVVILDYMDVIMDDNFNLENYHRSALESADLVIFWSKALMKYITSRYKVRSYGYVPFGCNLKIFNPRKVSPKIFLEAYGIHNKFIITYSGGVWRKNGRDLHGVDKLIEVMSKVYRRIKDAVFVLQYPYDRMLFNSLKDKGLLTHIVWVKPTPFNDVVRQSMFSASDILLLPSTEFPAVYLAERMKTFEYLAAGKAIVAERTPGILGVLSHKYNSYIVGLNDVEGMTNAIEELYYDKDLREHLGNNAFKDAKTKYDWEVLARNYRDILLKTVNL